MNALELRNYENLNEEEKNVFRIALRDNMKNELMQIKDIETGVDYLNKVKAIQVWAKAEKKDAELQNIIGEQKLRTQRKLGDLIKKGQQKGEIQSQGGHNKKQSYKKELCSISDFGINKRQSHEFQKIASLPEETFENEIETAKAETNKRIELTTTRMLKVAKKIERDNDLQKQKEDIDKLDYTNLLDEYDVLVVDPPWEYNRTYDPDGSRIANPYPSMSLDEIKNINLPSSENSVLWLWSTHAYLYEAKDILEHWGFEYKATLVWNKDKMGMGNWLRMQCEFCLLGIKGKPIYNNTKYRDIITEKGREHSRKPDCFYDMVNDICLGSKLDYFSREQRSGWYNYGNQINKFK